MAKFSWSHNQISGKLGNYVYYVVKGKQYVRTLPAQYTPTASPARTKQQHKWRLATRFAQAINPLIKVTYRERTKKLTSYNLLTKELLLYGINQENEGLSIDYSTIKISRGDSRPAFGAKVSCTEDVLQFSWYYDEGIACIGDHNDKAVLVAYCEALNECIYITNGPDRSLGKATLDITAFAGHEVHTWLGFISADGKQAANSIYLGVVRPQIPVVDVHPAVVYNKGPYSIHSLP